MDGRSARAAKHVLIVDDYPPICRGMALLLRSAGLSVTIASGGGAALSRLAEFTPDLVLLDVSMPDIDGLEVLRRVRADPRTAGIPVIVLSADRDPHLRERAIGAGANEFWPKIGIDYASLPSRLMAFVQS